MVNPAIPTQKANFLPSERCFVLSVLAKLIPACLSFEVGGHNGFCMVPFPLLKNLWIKADKK